MPAARAALLLRATCVAGQLLLPSCLLQPGPSGYTEQFERFSADDLLVLTVDELEREYDVILADRQAGRIETAWSPVKPVGGLARRSRAIVRLSPEDGRIGLHLRVQSQVRRLGTWRPAADDNVRAADLLRRIRSHLNTARPLPGQAGPVGDPTRS